QLDDALGGPRPRDDRCERGHYLVTLLGLGTHFLMQNDHCSSSELRHRALASRSGHARRARKIPWPVPWPVPWSVLWAAAVVPRQTALSSAQRDDAVRQRAQTRRPGRDDP